MMMVPHPWQLDICTKALCVLVTSRYILDKVKKMHLACVRVRDRETEVPASIS